MPIVYNWGPSAGAIGAVAAGAGARDAAMADRDFYAKLGSLFSNSFQRGQEQAQQERISAANRAQQQAQFEQTQQRMADMQRAQFLQRDTEAEREQRYRMEALTETNRLQQRRDELEQMNAYRRSLGQPPLTQLEKDEIQQMQALESELSRIQRQLAAGELSPQLAAAHGQRILSQLGPLRLRRQFTEQSEPIRQHERLKDEIAVRTIPWPDPTSPTGFRNLLYNPRTQTLEDPTPPRASSAQGSGAFPNVSPAAIRTELTARQRAHERANAENQNAAPFDVNDPKNIQEAAEAAQRTALIANRRWGTSAVSQTIGREISEGRTERNGVRLRSDILGQMERIQEIANLTLGFTDPQGVANYMPEVQETLAAIYRTSPERATRLRNAIAGVQVSGTAPNSNGSGLLRQTTNAATAQAPPRSVNIDTARDNALRRMAEEAAMQATMTQGHTAPAAPVPTFANPSDLWMPETPPVDQGEELQRVNETADEDAKAVEYRENRQAIDRYVDMLRRQLADLPMLTPAGRRARQEQIERAVNRLREQFPLNASDIEETLGLAAPAATLP